LRSLASSACNGVRCLAPAEDSGGGEIDREVVAGSAAVSGERLRWEVRRVKVDPLLVVVCCSGRWWGRGAPFDLREPSVLLRGEELACCAAAEVATVDGVGAGVEAERQPTVVGVQYQVEDLGALGA
jgi:hypothetical protein